MIKAIGYTRFVALSKRFLWVLVAGMVAMVVWVASYNTGENGSRIVFSNIPKAEILQNIMLKPHYQGVDKQNRPYTVLADKARQLDKEQVELENIHADMMLKDGSWIALTAGKGLLNLTTKQLDLQSGLDVFYREGYEFRTDHAHVDIQEGSAYGDAGIEGQGPLGTITASSFSMNSHGESINFNGSVRIKLYR